MQVIHELAKQDVNFLISNVTEKNEKVDNLQKTSKKENNTTSGIKFVESCDPDTLQKSSVMKVVMIAWSRMMFNTYNPSDFLLKSAEAIDQKEQLILVDLLILYLRVNETDVHRSTNLLATNNLHRSATAMLPFPQASDGEYPNYAHFAGW